MQKMGKIAQTEEDLKSHLQDHLTFLKLSSKSYDEGHTGEIKRLAASLRVLLHDTQYSISILEQLRIKNDLLFINTATKPNPANLLTHSGLAAMAMSNQSAKFVPYLDSLPGPSYAAMRFTKWWSETVIIDNKRNKISRKDLVLSIANQDGGVHVDPMLNKVYANLSRHNSIAWQFVGSSTRTEAVESITEASMRQIAHEVLTTLEHQLSTLISGAEGASCACGRDHIDPRNSNILMIDRKIWKLDCAYKRAVRLTEITTFPSEKVPTSESK